MCWICCMFGYAAVGLLTAVSVYFDSTVETLTPDKVYSQIFGSIQQQINQVLNDRSTATLTARLSTLSSNANDEMVAYMALMGLRGDPRAAMKDMRDDIIPIPEVDASQIDLHMKGIDSILSASNDWFTNPDNLDSKSAFVLVDVAAKNSKWCLHTDNHNVDASTKLVVSDDCELNSLSDKMFVIDGSSKDRLLLRTSTGDFCVAYENGDGTNYARNPLVIYPLSSPPCKEQKTIITAIQGADKSWTLQDGTTKICIDEKGFLFSSKAFEVPVPDVSGEGNSIEGTATDNNPCAVTDWSFKSAVPVILNKASQGGISAAGGTAPYTYDEIGVKLFYFNALASYHLLALKEWYLHGVDTDASESLFTKKVSEYAAFLQMHIPAFEGYASFALVNATAQIEQAKEFMTKLGSANLKQSSTIFHL